MDCQPYCRESNLVSYQDFIEDLKTKDLILIGEEHFNKDHEKNEKTILKELSKTKKFNIVTEDNLPSQNQSIVEAIEDILSKEIPTMAIMGSLHLKDCRSVDALIREKYSNISITVIIQENNDHLQTGIYKIKSFSHQDYLLVGLL